ncbi:MAG: DegV family protein [Clostridiales bacterium]|nr:DegV family protein [Clostridiales bacterium]
MKFILSTDTSCDINRGELTDRGIEYRPLVYTIDDVAYFDEATCDADYKAFYDQIRAGKMPTTSQINVTEHEEYFDGLLKKYDMDIIHITLSSGLSNTYESASTAAANINEREGKKRVYVVDSLAATVVQRIVVDEAEKMRNDGLAAAEAADKLESITHHVLVWFMPTDLMQLKRGGRVSGASAVIGTALNIKPILVINKKGGLSVVAKKIGVGKGMNYMADKFKEYNDESTAKTKVYIPSADSDYAEEMLGKIKAIRPDCEVEVGWVGPVIGAHTGPGMCGVAFLSNKEREV